MPALKKLSLGEYTIKSDEIGPKILKIFSGMEELNIWRSRAIHLKKAARELSRLKTLRADLVSFPDGGSEASVCRRRARRDAPCLSQNTRNPRCGPASQMCV